MFETLFTYPRVLRRHREGSAWPRSVPRTAEVLRDLLGPRIDGPREAPIFLNVHSRPLTRYGIHGLVVRTAKKPPRPCPLCATSVSARIPCATPQPSTSFAPASTSTRFARGWDTCPLRQRIATPRWIWR